MAYLFIRSRFRRTGDRDHIAKFSECLFQKAKGLWTLALTLVLLLTLTMLTEDTFDCLDSAHSPIRFYKKVDYDVVNPFDDERAEEERPLWVFDIEGDMLYRFSEDGPSRMPISLLQSQKDVDETSLESLGNAISSPLCPTLDSNMTPWKPEIDIDRRVWQLTRLLIDDFHIAWEHITRYKFNSITLGKLARGLIRLATLDFEVIESMGEPTPRDPHVAIRDLPRWEGYEAPIVRVGNLWVVLCQAVQEGLSMAQSHAASEEFSVSEVQGLADPASEQAHYMVLTVKHVMLCRVIGPGKLCHTMPEPLYNGNANEMTSCLATEYVVWATESARNVGHLDDPPVHNLPLEIQEMVLQEASRGKVASAHIGCVYNLGLPFDWSEGGNAIWPCEGYVQRPSGIHVDSEIWFGSEKSGLVYFAHDGSVYSDDDDEDEDNGEEDEGGQ